MGFLEFLVARSINHPTRVILLASLLGLSAIAMDVAHKLFGWPIILAWALVAVYVAAQAFVVYSMIKPTRPQQSRHTERVVTETRYLN